MKVYLDETGLHRLFASELFDANIAIHYLFKSKEVGILQFLGNRLFDLPPAELDFYLPQLLILYLYTEEDTRKCIHPFLVKRCKENIDFALNCALLLGSVNDSLPQSRKKLAEKLRNAIIKGESAISRQNSSCSDIGTAQIQNAENNEQLTFIESLIDIGRRLVSQPDRESKTQRLVSELNELNLHLPRRVWNPIASELSHFVLRITPAAAVVLNSKDKAPYFAYLESPPVILDRQTFSDEETTEEELDETIKPVSVPIATHISSNDASDVSDHDEQAYSPPSQKEAPQSDNVSLSRISIRSGDSVQSYDTGHTVLAADIRLRLHQETTASMGDLRIDPDDPSAAALKEPFAEKERKIREASPYGHLKNWKLLPIIVKCGDDLRQEMLAYQLMTALKAAWDKEMTKIWIRPYKILVTGPDSGILEPIVNAPSVHQIKKMEPGGLQAYFIKEFGAPTSEGYMTAMNNFVLSCAGYSLVCYLLQVKDRHNGNILLDSEGHIVHIDFGFMLNSYAFSN
ncbi:Oidioi.mRNA.OKI2018_I69.XSR.g13415.t1.cds [Oikopleura dioica]|uniref:Phosphatidylinositol 4-kinase beta n=1 Tax=Oikopleura dioica TaxID=34765 RepID=A0ABN7SAH7_OIKDI|nr:Oidioi.mRNA.OKI2018_I69.XSR.g13415.t1.cds [Oikopleura dioica]